MAYSAVIVTVAEMQFMAGENVDATGDVEANHIFLQDYAEGYLSALMQDDVATNFPSGYDTTTKQMITEWAARHAGMQLIAFNMNGYTTRQEAEDLIDIHIYRMEKIEELLKLGRAKKQVGK